MKKTKKIFAGISLVFFLIILVHVALGYGYIIKAVFFTYLRGQKGPGIAEHHLFYNHKLASVTPVPFNDQEANISLDTEDSLLLEDLETAGFLVIKDKEIIHESYLNGFSQSSTTNSFSAAKSMVSLCVGVAIDEGYISSVNEKVSTFLPSFKEGEKTKITIRHLLTMSSGLSWSESGKNPYSNNAEAYYGEDLRGLVLDQEVKTPPGKVFDYKSGDTQLLTFILEKATGKTLGAYFYEKIWAKINTEHQGYWNLDKENGDEKGYCCLYASARDFAKFSQLILNNGSWEGEQLISKEYLQNALFPAQQITEKSGAENKRYGWHWWYAKKEGKHIHYGRGLFGQYYVTIPSDNLIIVRTGWKRKPKGDDGHTQDFWDYIRIAYTLSNKI